MRDEWPEIAKLSLAGYSSKEVAARVGRTPAQVERARLAMRQAGMLPLLKRGYRPKPKPELSCADYAAYIAETLARLHDAKLSDGSFEDADRLIRGVIAEIERQAMSMISARN